MSKNICCFGASVTQQKEGYPTFLNKYLKNNYDIQTFGYGSHNISNAGILYIDDIVKNKPLLCILDWFVTGFNDINDTIYAINIIVYKLMQINCICLFTFFLCINENNCGKKYYDTIKKYMDSHNLKYIDFEDHLDFSNILIKDDVHTTMYGGNEYAKILASYINNINFDNYEYYIPINIITKNNFYMNILKYDIGNGIVINENDNIVIQFDKIYEYIFCVMQVGPHSGIIKINDIEINTWDIYCHFERTVTRKININSDKIIVNVLPNLICTSNCRREIDFTLHKKQLRLIDIFLC